MFGVAVTNDGNIVINLNGVNTVIDPQAAEDLCGLIYHCIEILNGEEPEKQETLQ